MVPHDFVSFFVCNIKKLIVGVFLPRKVITILQIITINFRQMSPIGVFLSVRVLEYVSKIL